MPKRVRTHVNPLSILKEISFEGFDNDHPVWVDVGACKGEFFYQLAKRFPEKNFVLFEIRKPLYFKLLDLFPKKEFPNVQIFDGDAGRNFKAILEPSVERGVKIEKVFVNFPDPWFKARHKKRRFVNEKFLKETSEWINKDVEWVFQTDQKFLFDETLEIVEESPFSKIEFFNDSVFGVPTDWESAKLRAGDEIWRMKFER
ncbi:MAG: tRNA (guanosine(46)-N7)-methyltransferase TrmB [Candidatus Peregrinibacteria bacterium]|nr:tRNA (guanosine(46)-N7)-methyltransferase TrmB [Candidatus Peregrinibacteria bacterium]